MMRPPCLIIAEVGSVHDGSLGNAKQLIQVARDSGADAVKFQTHIAEAETLRDAPSPSYFAKESRYEYFQRTAFSFPQWQELRADCEGRGIEFMSSPFSLEAVDVLERVGMARYKVPSGEVTNIPLLEHIASTRKPVLLSSGMSTWAELDRAVNAILRVHDRLTVLQCTSEYPCRYEAVGLNVMVEMGERYRLPVGLSDHTITPFASLAAVTLGASVIERHLTFSRLMYGSDAVHSLEPAEFAELTRGVRAIEAILAHPVDKANLAVRLQPMKDIFEKSVVAMVNIPKGTVVTRVMLGLKKPGTGISSARLEELLGRRANRDISKDHLIMEGDLRA